VNFRHGFYAGLIVALVWGGWLAFLWQPERQVELHNVHLLEQIEKRDWKAVAEFVEAAYQDRGAWPRDWKLVSVRNSALEIPQ
jgi:hypothetical protein